MNVYGHRAMGALASVVAGPVRDDPGSRGLLFDVGSAGGVAGPGPGGAQSAGGIAERVPFRRRRSRVHPAGLWTGQTRTPIPHRGRSTFISVEPVCRSGWVVEAQPLIAPAVDHPEEVWGVEDPRVTRVDELDCWVIAYTAFGPLGPAVSLAVTRDFRSVERLGVVCQPEDKNASLLPRRVGGNFVLFHRPTSTIGGRADVWISRSSALRGWTAPEPVFGARVGGLWDCARVGVGPPPGRRRWRPPRDGW